jgi:hypothetical protein
MAEMRTDLVREIGQAKTDTIKWVLGVGFAQVVALVGAVIAIVRFLPGGAP